MQQSKLVEEKEYFRIDQYSFRNLTPKHQARAQQILIHQFHRQEPLMAAYSKKYPNDPCSIQLWSQCIIPFMDNAATNNLSAVVLDTQSDDKVIATFICRDMCFVPQVLIDSLQIKTENPHTFVFELEEEMRKQLKQELKELLNQKGRTADFLAVAIDHAYLGRKIIFKNMLLLVERLAKEEGYTHGHIFAGNGKTNIVAKNANYQLIARVNAAEIVLRNKQPFSQIEQLHKNPTIWVKKL